MEQNPAYGFFQENNTSQRSTTLESVYESVGQQTTAHNRNADKENMSKEQETPKVEKTPRERSIVGIVATTVSVLALVVAIAAIIAVVVLNQTDNSNQEIQSLQLEIANLREMLNKTERDLQTQHGKHGKHLIIFIQLNTCTYIYHLEFVSLQKF